MILYEGRADTKTFLMGTGCDEADGRDAIVHQFLCKFAAGHSRVAYGKVEAVGNGTVKVFVIDDVEIVLQENLLQLVRPLTINNDFITELIFAVACCLQHGSHGILGTMTCTG